MMKTVTVFIGLIIGEIIIIGGLIAGLIWLICQIQEKITGMVLVILIWGFGITGCLFALFILFGIYYHWWIVNWEWAKKITRKNNV